jgi:hypothetical protein
MSEEVIEGYSFEKYLKSVKYCVETSGNKISVGVPMIFLNLCKELLEWDEKYDLVKIIGGETDE